MKYVKRTLALLLAMMLLLAGCSSNPADTKAPANTTDPTPFVPPNSVPMLGGDTQPAKPQESGTVQYLPEEVENPDGLPVLQWLCLGTTSKSEAAMAEINRVLAEKKMPFRLQFVLYSVTERMDSWFALEEVAELAGKADLITGAINAEEAVQYLSPITQNAAGTAEPSLANAFIHSSYYGKTTVDGEVYGIPAMTTELQVIGWRVDNSVLKDGVTVEDFTRNYWEMDDVFAKLYASSNNKPFLLPIQEGITKAGQATNPAAIDEIWYAEFAGLAACYAIDYTLETPAVVNILDTERIRLTQAAMKRYTDAGYFVIEDERSSASVRCVRLHADFPYARGDCQYIPAGKTQARGNAPSGGYVTGISVSSQNKDAALSLLALMADDLDFRKLLFFGREGKEYQIEDGTLRILPDENGNVYSMTNLSSLVDFCGLKLDYHKQYFPTLDGESLGESFPAMLERSVIRYPINGTYGFDTANVNAEIDAVNEILEKQAGDFSTLDPEAYDELLKKIKDAGGDKIQAELQRQLDAWLAENPDWSK